MKTLLLLLLSFVSYAQSYEIIAFGDYSYDVKSKGLISCDSSKVVIEIEGKAKEYTFVSDSNDVIYFTDGVMTDYLQVIKKQGKKKGKEYDTILVLNFDKRKNTNSILLFYCKWRP